MKTLARLGLVFVWALVMAMGPASSRDFAPRSDAEVVESLPPRVRPAAATPESAGAAARQAIELARQTADPRYLGRAQAALAPWWGRADAPVPLAILQATVQQSRHEFDAARSTLTQALQRDASQAQGWLTLATLERVAGRYAAADAACKRVGQNLSHSGAALYAAACQLETASLQGRLDEARRGLQALRRQAPDAATQAWLLSLLGESEERAGRDAPAATAYQASLALAADGYTALAYADLLLRTRQADAALNVLAGEAPSDAVLLRRAQALRLRGNPQWQALASEAAQRLDALDARGDNPAWHARERALLALWLQDQPALAWSAAQLNLQRQKEPLDWRLALQSAERAGDQAGLARLREELAATGLRDARLTPWLAVEGKR